MENLHEIVLKNSTNREMRWNFQCSVVFLKKERVELNFSIHCTIFFLTVSIAVHLNDMWFRLANEVNTYWKDAIHNKGYCVNLLGKYVEGVYCVHRIFKN